MLARRLLLTLALSLTATASAWEESFPAAAGTWNEQQVLEFILARSPILKGYQVVTKEYTPRLSLGPGWNPDDGEQRQLPGLRWHNGGRATQHPPSLTQGGTRARAEGPR
jgi:hypothetical protein